MRTAPSYNFDRREAPAAPSRANPWLRGLVMAFLIVATTAAVWLSLDRWRLFQLRRRSIAPIERPLAPGTRVITYSRLSTLNEGGAIPQTQELTGQLSANGNVLAFSSIGETLAPGDANEAADVFVRDVYTNRIERVSVGNRGVEADGHSSDCAVSEDGRFVVFASDAPNLAERDENGTLDVFLHDRETRRTELISATPNGAAGRYGSFLPHVAGGGRWVVFASEATDLAPGDRNDSVDIFLRDRQTGATELVSVSSRGTQANSHCWSPTVSADGRFVVWLSNADNLAPGDRNGLTDAFVRDRQEGVTTRIAASSGSGRAPIELARVSGSGEIVVFHTRDSRLAAADENGFSDVFAYVIATGALELISADTAGAPADGSSTEPYPSGDGRYVIFVSTAANLLAPREPDDEAFWGARRRLRQGDAGVYLRDRRARTTTRIDVPPEYAYLAGSPAAPSLSHDGGRVALRIRGGYYPGSSPGDAFLIFRRAGE